MCRGADPAARAGASEAVGGCDLGALPCRTFRTPHPSLTVTTPPPGPSGTVHPTVHLSAARLGWPLHKPGRVLLV